MKRMLVYLLACCLLIGVYRRIVWSGEVDILVEKLVEKKILTREEADGLLKEMRAEAEKSKAQAVEEVKEALTEGKSGVKLVALPEWVAKMKLSGDFRLRYEMIEREGLRDRHRGRYRLRAGVETEVVDNIKVAFGLATGPTNPRTSNQSFANSFESPDIRLDYAYVEYAPSEWATLIGGKMKQPWWEPYDFLFDSDIRPEGGAAQFTWQLHPRLTFFFNTGLFVLDERSDDTQDPIMYVFQPGVNWKIIENLHWKTAAGYYGFSNVKGTTLDHSTNTNTLRNGVLRYDYDSLVVATELGIKKPLATPLPYLALLGEYVRNDDPSKNNDGFLAGWKIGYEKVKEKGQWQVSYAYRRLERDAWPDIFPDNEFYGAETGVKGHETIIKYGLNKNVAFVLDYYHTQNLHGRSRTENLLQADLEFNF